MMTTKQALTSFGLDRLALDIATSRTAQAEAQAELTRRGLSRSGRGWVPTAELDAIEAERKVRADRKAAKEEEKARAEREAIEANISRVARRVFEARQARTEHPAGTFDKSKRFYPDTEIEACDCCRSIRRPSRAHPFSLMVHCRTLTHCRALVRRQLTGE